MPVGRSVAVACINEKRTKRQDAQLDFSTAKRRDSFSSASSPLDGEGSMATTHDVLRGLWTGAGLPDEHLQHANISLINADKHVLQSSYRIGAAAQACIAATSLAASLYHHLTTGSVPVTVEIDARHAALEFASERFSSQYPTPVSHSKRMYMLC
jgi:hypothetical protein